MPEHPGVPFSAIRDAIQHRDITYILSAFFQGKPPRLNGAFHFESDLWDYKAECPGHGPVNAPAWAQIAADVLAFYNTNGGVLFFGIADHHYSYAGTKTPLDSKQFNDKIRKYTGDKFWVSYAKPFIEHSGRYLGVAVIPKRRLAISPFFADAPSVDGKHYFSAGDIAVRTGDETKILRGEKATDYLRSHHIPHSDSNYLVIEPSYRIMRPDWDEFVPRDTLCRSVQAGLQDDRTFVTSLTGIGGVGKTALACWGALQAYENKWFDYITSITAKDRELTLQGISDRRPTGSTLDDLLDSILEAIGFSELAQLPTSDKEKEVKDLLRGSRSLLFVDNLETVQDQSLISFIETLPQPVKAIVTARKALVRRGVFPVDVGQFEEREALTFTDLVAARKGRDFIHGMKLAERRLIIDSCYRIPLVIEWFLGLARDEATAVELARQLEANPKQSEELLEFCFRRVHTSLDEKPRKILKALSMFTEAQPVEALGAACAIPLDAAGAGLDELVDASLVLKEFDPRLKDTTYGLLPLTRRFAYAELQREPGQEQALRRALSVWYEGADIADPGKRRVMVEIRKGKRDVDTLLVDAAKELRVAGRPAEAEELLIQATQRNPQSWRAFRELGDLYKNESKVAPALEYYRRAATLAPKKGKDRALIYREYGILLRDSGTPTGLADATDALEAALAQSPNDPVCMYVLAQVLVRREMYDRAMPHLERLVHRDDVKARRNAYPLLKRGSSAVSVGRR